MLAANRQFYAAVEQMFQGKLDAMREVWSHAADVVYMNPTGNYDRGWAEVLKDWEGQAALKLGGKIEPQNMLVVIGSDLAVVYNSEVGENTNAKGKVERVNLRGTNIYRKENGKWLMIGHHTDLLPFLVK